LLVSIERSSVGCESAPLGDSGYTDDGQRTVTTTESDIASQE
jgi:hypothetical protein